MIGQVSFNKGDLSYKLNVNMPIVKYPDFIILVAAFLATSSQTTINVTSKHPYDKHDRNFNRCIAVSISIDALLASVHDGAYPHCPFRIFSTDVPNTEATKNTSIMIQNVLY